MPLKISGKLSIPDREIEFTAIHAQGAGGQNVNKVSSAVHLRFDINTSSLPERCKRRLLTSGDRRITRNGVIVIKAQRYRSQEKNRQEALQRLQQMVLEAAATRKRRIATRPTLSSRRKRLDEKVRNGRIKRLRGRVVENDRG